MPMPAFLEAWKNAARWLGGLQARFLLGVFYFVFLGPFALLLRLTDDPLALKPGSPHGWSSREAWGDPAKRAGKQF